MKIAICRLMGLALGSQSSPGSDMMSMAWAAQAENLSKISHPVSLQNKAGGRALEQP